MLKTVEIACIVIVSVSLIGACITATLIQCRSYSEDNNIKTALISQTV